jgi:membrane protease YdiL (CAAX protease family)
MIELWLLTPLVVLWWLWSGRALSLLGFGVPGGWAFWVGVIVVVSLATALGHQVALVRASAEARAQVRKQFRGVPALMVPRDSRERRMWVGLSLTAGLCEEVLYRGFLMWYLMSWLPEAAAVLASAAVFGVAHLYLGWGIGVLRATVVGVVLGVAYLLTGTLWVPIVLHAVVDVTSGLTGSVALEQDAPITCQSIAGGGVSPLGGPTRS